MDSTSCQLNFFKRRLCLKPTQMSQWTDAEREEVLRRRQEGPLMATPLSSASVMKFVSKGVVSIEDTGPEKEDFLPSEAFDGTKPGYVFKVAIDQH